MAQVGLVKTTWIGTSGGPGLTQIAINNPTGDPISASQAGQAGAAVRAFWDAIKAYIPNEITLTVLPTVDCYEVGAFNNSLASSLTMPTTPAAVVGGDVNAYSMASGLKANLNTNVIRFGRRVRGSIYIVPAGYGAYTVNGTVAPLAKTAVDNAGSAMVSAMATAGLNLVVWSRWNEVKHPDRTSFASIVSSVKTNDMTAILRGRRD
jgi:hypothetical protein